MSPTTKNWIIATRPWSFPASTMPALVAISYIFYSQQAEGLTVNWGYGLLALLGACIFQASGNLIGDYFDYKYKVDRKESFGSSRLLVDGVFQPKSILYFGVGMLLLGSLLGIYLLLNTGRELLWIGLFGVFSTYFYYKLKFMALGDLLIFIIYGPLIALGTAYVMTNELNVNVFLLSIPIAFLVVNILHANNTRDIFHDGQANIKTQAMLLGLKGSKIQYILLALGAYVVVSILVALNILHPLCLAVVITLPLALKNIRLMQMAEVEKPELIKDLDASSAQLVMAFSVIFALSNLIAKWL